MAITLGDARTEVNSNLGDGHVSTEADWGLKVAQRLLALGFEFPELEVETYLTLQLGQTRYNITTTTDNGFGLTYMREGGFNSLVEVPRTGSTLLTYGDFSASTGWTTGTNHTIGSNVLTLASAANASTTYRSPNSTLTQGVTYMCIFTINSISGGGVKLVLGGTSGTTRTTAGTYAEALRWGSGSTFNITAVGTTSCVVDNVYLYAVETQRPIVEYVTPTTWESKIAGLEDNTGDPIFYTRFQNIAIFHKVPDEVKTLRCRYRKWPVFPSASGNYFDFNNCDEALVIIATAATFARWEQFQEANMWMAMAKNFIQGLKAAEGVQINFENVFNGPRMTEKIAGGDYWADPFYKGGS